MNLKDKVIYVTGASLGIGYEIASELLKQDAKVVITARNKENLDKAKNALSKISNNVQAHAFDISDENELKKSMNNVYDHFGKIDGLVNNAPSIHPGMIKDMSLSQWKTNFKANLEGAFLTTNYVLPKMMEQKSGSIVNISSVAGTKGISFISAYAAAKSALINFSKSFK